MCGWRRSRFGYAKRSGSEDETNETGLSARTRLRIISLGLTTRKTASDMPVNSLMLS
jgi:hypothetical protein